MSIFENDTVKELRFYKGSTDISNNILANSFNLEDILVDEQLNFGSCNSARISFMTLTDLSLTGETIVVKFGAGETWETIGTYHITYSASQENSTRIKCTGYDSVKYFDINVADWYVGLTFPITLKNFRDSLCDYIGVEQITVSLVNDSMPIERTISPSKLNGIDVLQYIGQINGVFPHSTSEGKLDYISLGTESKTISESVINGADGVVKKNYYTSAISKLVINSEDGDIGVSVGDGSNIFYVTANILVYGKSIADLTAIGQNLLNKIGGNTYVPMTLNMKYLPDLKLGDRIAYQGYGTYVLSRKSSGILFDVIKAEGTEKLKEDTSITTEIEQLRGKSNVLTRDIEKTSLKIDDVEAGLSNEITQTANALKLQIEELSKEIGGDAEIYVTDEVPTLENYPANTFCEQIFPADNLYPSDDLYWHYTYESYKRHLGSSVFVQGSSVSYKFTANDNGTFEWTAIEDSQLSYVMNRLTSLEVRTDGIEATVDETVSTVSSQGQQISQNTSSITAQAGQISSKVSTTTYNADKKTITDNIDNLGDRVSTTESSITQQSNSIESLVEYTGYEDGYTKNIKAQIDMKVDTDNLVSSINASADVISLNGRRISINSDYFKLTQDGHITATAGNLGGWDINSNSISKTANAYIAPQWDVVEKIRQYMLTGQGISDSEKYKYDFNGDGSIDLLDIVKAKQYIYGQDDYSNCPNKVASSITVKIDPTNPNATISITGRDAWGNSINQIFGANEVNIRKMNAETVMCNDHYVPYSSDNQLRKFNIANDWSYLETTSVWNNNNQEYTYGITWWSSDERLKKNIEDAENIGLDFVDSIKHRQFDWNDEKRGEGHIQMGYVAQEIEEIDNGCVKHIPQPESAEYSDLLQIDESRVIPYLSKAIQELHDIVKEQSKEIETLKALLKEEE